MDRFIKFLGGFVPASELDKFEFTTTQSERDAAQAESLAAFAQIEQGGGFNTWAKQS